MTHKALDTEPLELATTDLAPSTPEKMLSRLREAQLAIRECLTTVDPAEPIEHDEEHPFTRSIELSVVMPCLNEADTLGICLEKALRAMRENDIHGEIIVADNGSVDGSIKIANELGARVVHVAEKGYGHALMGGIEAARGRYVLMGDADDSYDFLEIPKFVEKLRDGAELVQGCRLPSGGGTIKPGAMPKLHRWWGNPMFSWMVRQMFQAPVHDVYCGMRGFTRELYRRLKLRSTGMEFATEMIIKSSLFDVKIAEVPTTLHPDGRKAHAPHLRTFRDGWRTLRFFLMYSPRWLFMLPGLGLCLLGLIGYCLAWPGLTIRGVVLDAHTLLAASLSLLLGFQLLQFGIFAKTFAASEGLVPEDHRLVSFLKFMNLERCLVYGVTAFFGGCFLLLGAFSQWHAAEFGQLEYAKTMRWVIPGVTMAALGFQTIFSSFFVSILRLARRK